MKSIVGPLAILLFQLNIGSVAFALPPPAAPTDTNHPGSKVYQYGFVQKTIQCLGRGTDVYLPTSATGTPPAAPLVAYGHGQALDLKNYQGTLEHLAKKGIAVVFPPYDTGFFDQDWSRMGSDYARIVDCAAKAFPQQIDSSRVVYAGHSKGAYVAQIAAGTAPGLKLVSAPKAIVLFEPAGADSATLATISPTTALTVVFSDKDSTVEKKYSEQIYRGAMSAKRQFIDMKSYLTTTPTLMADHFWPLTKGAFFGGGPESALHYFGGWKWLVAAARDLSNASVFSDPYLYGAEAVHKGHGGATDLVSRTF